MRICVSCQVHSSSGGGSGGGKRGMRHADSSDKQLYRRSFGEAGRDELRGDGPRDPILQRRRRKNGRWDRGGETTPGETLF